jgi:phage terminase small subunit
MARPRLPTEVLTLRGAFTKDPQRKRPPEAKAAPLQGAPAYLASDEAALWRELVANAPRGVLTTADGPTLEMVSRLMAKFRRDWLTGAEFSILKSCLTELGWTPASRSKVLAPEGSDKPAGEFDEFIQ